MDTDLPCCCWDIPEFEAWQYPLDVVAFFQMSSRSKDLNNEYLAQAVEMIPYITTHNPQNIGTWTFQECQADMHDALASEDRVPLHSVRKT